MGSTAPAAILVEPLAELAGVIERLGQEDLHQVPSSCLGDDVRRIRCAVDRLEAEFSRRLGRFDSDQGWVPDGNASTAGWLSVQCRMVRNTAWERVRQARRPGEL